MIMKTKTTLLVLLLSILAISTVKAQSELFFSGYVYFEDSSEKQIMMPFATIKFYEVNNPDKIAAVTISETNGGYKIMGLDTYNKYIVKVSAPGINEQTFISRPNSGKIKSGNISVHTKLVVDEGYKNPVEKQSFLPDTFEDNKDLTLVQMIELLPELEVVSSDIMTKDGGSVRVMINGFNSEAILFSQLKDYPVVDLVKSMDYYDLSDFEGSLYDGVLNIRLNAGEEALAPNFRAMSLKPYNK